MFITCLAMYVYADTNNGLILKNIYRMSLCVVNWLT